MTGDATPLSRHPARSAYPQGWCTPGGQRRLGDLCHDLEQHLSEAQQQGAPWPESLFVDVQSGFRAYKASWAVGACMTIRLPMQQWVTQDATEPLVSQAGQCRSTVAVLDSPFLAASAVPAKLKLPGYCRSCGAPRKLL